MGMQGIEQALVGLGVLAEPRAENGIGHVEDRGQAGPAVPFLMVQTDSQGLPWDHKNTALLLSLLFL